MLDRLNPFAVPRAHWRGLRNRVKNQSTPDNATRAFLIVAAGGVLAWCWTQDVHLEAPGIMVSGLSLLSAGLLAAFAQLAGIRSRYEAPDDPAFDGEIDTRNMLDEAVAHILTAALLSASAAFLIIVGMNVNDPSAVSAGTGSPVQPPPVSPDVLGTHFSAVVAGAGTYLFLLFVMTVRKLYAAYVLANDVSKELSGHHR